MKNEIVIHDQNMSIDIKKSAWAGLSKETRKAYSSDYKMFFDFVDKIANEVTGGDIISYIEHLERSGMKSRTINRKIASLSKFFEIAKLAGDIQVNPVRMVSKLTKITRSFSRQAHSNVEKSDIERLVVEYKNGTLQQKKMCVIIRFLASTGLRVSEFIFIKNKDIYGENNGKRIRVVGKGKKERFIFISSSMYNDVKRIYKEENEYLFYTIRRSHYNRKVLWKQINNAFLDTTGKNVHPHSLRHFFATYKISVEKQDIKAVSLYIGHADVSTTLQMYVDTALDNKSAVLKI